MLCVALFCGCARFTVTTGKKIKVADLNGMQPGKTTRAVILETFGPPQVLDPATRSASFGTHHLAYEARQSTGWHIMIHFPILSFPLLDFFSANEESDSTVFLFDDNGTLVDFAQSSGPVGKRSAFGFLHAVRSTMLVK